jgi:hypothetical protein
VSANIWDNIFGNYNAPVIFIPQDFTVTFGIDPVDSPLIIDVDYSTIYGGIKFTC